MLISLKASIDQLKKSVDDLKESANRQFAELNALIQAQAQGANRVLTPIPNDSRALPPPGIFPITWEALEHLSLDTTDELLRFYGLDTDGAIEHRRQHLSDFLRMAP